MAVLMPRDIRISGAVAFVLLTRGKEAVIDASDARLISRWSWQAIPEPNGTFYAARTATAGGAKKLIRMHRAILAAEPGQDVDHANCDGLDNQRENLRLATRSQNRANTQISRRNTSGYKGVMRNGDRWKAAIRVHGKSIYLGAHDTPEQAHKAYVEAAQTLFGAFARSA